jgi:predicted dithiol-disulfide oxidoreductase (DUF899 family)
MRDPGQEWQCPGCTGFASQFSKLEFLDGYDARFVIVTQGPIEQGPDASGPSRGSGSPVP